MNFNQNGHQQFLRDIANGIGRYEQTGKLFMTGFLTPAQRIHVEHLLKYMPHRFFGGPANTMRQRLVVGDEDVLETLEAISCLQGRPKGDRELRHADVLGALMHAGLERDAIGDIVIDQDAVYVICLPSVKDFIVQSITTIGRTSVVWSDCLPQTMPEPKFEVRTINTASMRADCIVGALARVSRSQAKDLIRQGFVKVNDEILESVKPLCDNDTISVRRTGKFQIEGLDGTSRKGRLIVRVRQFQ